MNLEKELKTKGYSIRYSMLESNYYIKINNSNYLYNTIDTISSIDINSLCSLISIGLINTNIKYIIKKFNLKIKDTCNSYLYTPNLTYHKQTYLLPKHSYFPKDRTELYFLIEKLIEIRGNECSLNDIDTSNITNMSYLFRRSSFKGDISKWDVSGVNDMDSMFYNSKFRGSISRWNVGNVVDMYDMFKGSPLEKNPPYWYIDFINKGL